MSADANAAPAAVDEILRGYSVIIFTPLVYQDLDLIEDVVTSTLGATGAGVPSITHQNPE